MNQPTVLPFLRPMRVAELLDVTIRLYRKNFQIQLILTRLRQDCCKIWCCKVLKLINIQEKVRKLLLFKIGSRQSRR